MLVLNSEHPFYREIYKPLVDGDSPRDQQLRVKLELLLLSAVRSEVSAKARTPHSPDIGSTGATPLQPS